MKKLNLKTQIAMLLAASLLTAPTVGWCGNITLQNQTPYVAQYAVRKGQQIIARIPGIAPGATMEIPTESTYTVQATTVLDGNSYTSAPIEVNGAMSFLAQVVANRSSGIYEFQLIAGPGWTPDTLTFQKTSLNPVTFTIAKDGRPLQTVVVNDSFNSQTLSIDEEFSVVAVVNGITTDVLVTRNPNATITAVEDTSSLEMGYFTLVEE